MKIKHALSGLILGLLLLTAGTSANASPNLVVNGGFEDPALAPGVQSLTVGPPWVIVTGGPNRFLTQDATTGVLHGGLVANSVGDNVVVLLTTTADYMYQTVSVTVGHQYTLSFLQGKGGDFFRSRGQRGSIVNPADNSVIASTGYLFPSTANDGSGTEVLFPASLTFTATTPTINVKFDSTQGTRTFSYFDNVVLVDNAPEPPTVNAAIALTKTGIALNRATNLWVQTDTLTNTTAAAIAGPIYLALDSLSATATLTNGTGVTANVAPLGSPYVQVIGAAGSLAPGASVSTVLLFSNPTRAAILYTGRILSGGAVAP